jgi:DNA repair protein RadA/Sms
MAAKKKTQYLCNNCGENFSVWAGKCPSCGEWNSLVEFHESRLPNKTNTTTPLVFAKLEESAEGSKTIRTNTGMDVVDDVLGGGIVQGSIILIAGEPGIGKSTLLLQLASSLADKGEVLYVSGEESAEQVSLRAKRLGLEKTNLNFSASTSADDIVSTIQTSQFSTIIVDSIQTISLESVESGAGTVSQITKSAQVIQSSAKSNNTTVILVGHVTKDGTIAGPKILEHLVDVVLNLEGDRYGGFKILRGVKNRFGSTNEIAIFEMKDIGLVPIENPSAALLAERQTSDGSVVFATLEGTRALLVEVQALVSKSSFGYPKRTAVGIDINRLNLLVAVLNQRTKLNLNDYDIFVNIVGGMKISEPAADLAVCMAIASAAKGMQIDQDAIVFGEVGLSGEVRSVTHAENRIKESKKLGFKFAIGPKTQQKNNYIKGVSNLRDALNSFLTKN